MDDLEFVLVVVVVVVVFAHVVFQCVLERLWRRRTQLTFTGTSPTDVILTIFVVLSLGSKKDVILTTTKNKRIFDVILTFAFHLGLSL